MTFQYHKQVQSSASSVKQHKFTQVCLLYVRYELVAAWCEARQMDAVSSPGVIVVIVLVVIIVVLAIAAAVVCYVRRRQGRRSVITDHFFLSVKLAFHGA